MRGERSWVFRQRDCFVRRIGGADLVGGFAGHFDVAAQGQQADLVVGVAVLDAKEPGPESHGKGFDTHAAQLGDGEVTKFMDYHHHAYKDDEGDNRNQKFMHRLRFILRANAATGWGTHESSARAV